MAAIPAVGALPEPTVDALLYRLKKVLANLGREGGREGRGRERERDGVNQPKKNK